MRLAALACALALLLAGCGGANDSPPTAPEGRRYIELRRVTYDGFGQINGVTDDSLAGPTMILWPGPGKQANLTGAVLATYYFPIPTRFGGSTSWAGSPRANFYGTWAGIAVPGDTFTVALVWSDGLPDSVFTSIEGTAGARWERVGNIDVAHVGSRVIVHKDAVAETLATYWTLGRVRTGLEQF